MAHTLVMLSCLWFSVISCAHFQCYLSHKPHALQRVKGDIRREYFIFGLKQWSIKTKKRYIKEIPISVFHHKIENSFFIKIWLFDHMYSYISRNDSLNMLAVKVLILWRDLQGLFQTTSLSCRCIIVLWKTNLICH